MTISRDSQVPYCQLSPKQHISCEISKGYFVLAPLFEYILDLFSEVDACARSEASWPSFSSVLSNSEISAVLIGKSHLSRHRTSNHTIKQPNQCDSNK